MLSRPVLPAAGLLLLTLVVYAPAVRGSFLWDDDAYIAVNPVYVESISWIQERKNLLSGFFFFAAALAYLRFARTPGDRAPVASARSRAPTAEWRVRAGAPALTTHHSPLTTWYVLALVL